MEFQHNIIALVRSGLSAPKQNMKDTNGAFFTRDEAV